MKKFLTKFLDFFKQWKYVSNRYQRVNIGNDFSTDYKELENTNRKLLRLNGLNTSKIRFIFAPAFTYDPYNNVVNPNYTVFIPLRNDNSNLFEKDAPVIEVNKPKNVIGGNVNTYKVEDNYEFIRKLTKKTKRGIVIYISEYQNAVRFDGTKFSYEFGVDSEELRLRNLDEIIVETEKNEKIL